jgi:4-amino-4-deoxy-L-arabinose transferase-like glycosyltransferase
MFTALLLFFLSLFRRDKQPRWLYLAALAAGLGTGAKPLGVFLLIPVLFTCVVGLDDTKGQRGARLAALCGIAFLAFVLTTPGVLLEPFTFIKDGRNISAIYAKGHGGFTTKSALQHWGQVLTFLSVSYFSPFKLVSLGMFALAVVGGVVWVRRDWRFGVALLAFPVTFLGVFCGKYNVMIARNYLAIAPILCVLAARGLEELAGRVHPRWARLGLAGGLAVLAVVQGAWLVQAAETVRHVDSKRQVRQAIEYVADHPGKQFRVSAKVRAVAAEQGIAMPPNVTAGPGGEAVVMFGRGDIDNPELYKENDPWLTDAVFGPREVNFNWYSVWCGFDRVVVMPIQKARDGGILFAR